MIALMREGFTEQDTWRLALGPNEPLLVWSDEIPTLDAPDWIPAGAMRCSNYTNRPRIMRIYRGGE